MRIWFTASLALLSLSCRGGEQSPPDAARVPSNASSTSSPSPPPPSSSGGLRCVTDADCRLDVCDGCTCQVSVRAGPPSCPPGKCVASPCVGKRAVCVTDSGQPQYVAPGTCVIVDAPK